MKLVFINGDDRGRVCDVTLPGISLGRESDNDVSILDSQASRYHAKLHYEDGFWRLEDCDSRNGVFVNGERIDGARPLSIQDEIRIGDSKLVFTDEDGVDALLAPSPTQAVAGAAADGEAAGRQSKPSRARPILLVLVLLILSMAVVALILSSQAAPEPAGPAVPAPAGMEAEKLHVYFERLIATADNVFRYELEVKDGLLTVRVDDLASDWHPTPEPVPLAEGELEGLRRDLVTEPFITLGSPPPETGNNRHERIRLAAMYGARGNYVRLVNVTIPPVIEDAMEDLATLVATKYDITPQPQDPAVILDRARESYDKGLKYYDKRQLDVANLREAVFHFRRVLALLRWRDPKPEFYQRTVELSAKAEELLNEKVDQLMSDAALEQRVGKNAEALLKYETAREMLGDPNDERYREAVRRIEALRRQGVR